MWANSFESIGDFIWHNGEPNGDGDCMFFSSNLMAFDAGCTYECHTACQIQI